LIDQLTPPEDISQVEFPWSSFGSELSPLHNLLLDGIIKVDHFVDSVVVERWIPSPNDCPKIQVGQSVNINLGETIKERFGKAFSAAPLGQRILSAENSESGGTMKGFSKLWYIYGSSMIQTTVQAFKYRL
jgi:hypothetical protein